jgi:predicted DsbA family dithiol-disulfide isomerase
VGYTARVLVAPGTLVVYADIGCPWAHVAVHRLHTARARLGLEEQVQFDHRAFALELANERPTPRLTLESEIPVTSGLESDAGWQLWQGPAHEYPVSTLLALEAVQAAKEQGRGASERLDRNLRRAMFGESRCITMLHVVLDVARQSDVDVDVLRDALEQGTSRQAVHRQHHEAEASTVVKGSPHVFAPGGMHAHNPGVNMHWDGGHGGKGFPVVDHDDPTAVEPLLQAAAATTTPVSRK